MANTLKFGDGKWAVKEGSALAYNDENGNFKPLPFTFDRSTSATRVNKQGLIEVVPNNEPRIDFLNDSKGALLLEPLRNNYIPYSTLDFNGGSKPEGWSIGFGTGTYSYEQLTYKGQKAVKQTQITTGRSYLDTGSISILANTEHTLKIQFILDECVADANDDIVSFLGFGVNTNYKFSDIDANGVLEVQYNPLSDNVGSLRIGLGCVENEDGGKSLAWAIPQLEQGSYATSHIPTQGSIGTRDAEICSGAGNEQVINSTEGVLYLETKGFIDDLAPNSKYIQLSKSGEASFNNSLVLQHRNNGYLRIYANGSATANIHFNVDIDFTENHKIAVLYKLNGYKLFIDGVAQNLFGTPLQTVFSGLDNLSFDLRGALGWDGNIKDVKLYNTALTDQELINLTKL